MGALGLLASQFAVCGPIVFGLFLFAVFRPAGLHLERADWLMMAFALPPLALVSLVALATSAKANWAAPAGIPITILAVDLLVRRRRWRWVQASIGLGLGVQILLSVADAFADRISLPWLANPDVYHRTMGWKSISALARQTAETNGVRAIAAEQSDVAASLRYYLRDDAWPILSWPGGAGPTDQFEDDRTLSSAVLEPLLFLTNRTLPEHLAEYYSMVDRLTPIDAATGPHSARRLFAFKLSGAGLKNRSEPTQAANFSSHPREFQPNP